MMFDENKVRAALKRSWSPGSARQWTAEKPVSGQCNVTAAVVQDLYGGEILKTPWSEQTHHYYNRIGGQVHDFTDSQFENPIAYADEPSSKQEASVGFTGSEYQCLKEAFLKSLDQEVNDA